MTETYADADPGEAVTVAAIGPMTLRRAVRRSEDWCDHHGLPLVVASRGRQEPPSFDMADRGRLAEMERFT